MWDDYKRYKKVMYRPSDSIAMEKQMSMLYIKEIQYYYVE